MSTEAPRPMSRARARRIASTMAGHELLGTLDNGMDVLDDYGPDRDLVEAELRALAFRLIEAGKPRTRTPATPNE